MFRWFKYIKMAKELEEKFPNEEQAKRGLEWIYKNVCPCCVLNPVEELSVAEYRGKYPIAHVVKFGHIHIYLCEHHFQELKEKLKDETKQLAIDVE